MSYDDGFQDPELQEDMRQEELLACDVCPTCMGSGKVRDWEKYDIYEWCSDCGGSGKHPKNHKE